MKYEEFVVEKAKQDALNVYAQIPFVNRKVALQKETLPEMSSEESKALEDVELRLHTPLEGQSTRLSKFAVLKQGLEVIDQRIALDEEAIASIAARQGLIREYTENLKKIDLQDLEQAMKEVHQDKILEKYQYFVGEV